MTSLPLAAAAELALLGAAVAVALLLLFQVRLTKRHDAVERDVEWLKTAHRIGTMDAQSRLEEATHALATLEQAVSPRIEGLEPQIADLSSRVDDLHEHLGKVGPAMERSVAQATRIEESLREAESRLEAAEQTAKDAGERYGELAEQIRDTRSRLEQLEGSFEHLRATTEGRLDASGRRGAGARRRGAGPAATEAEDEEASLTPPSSPNAVAAQTGDEDEGIGLRGVVTIVILVAALTLLFQCISSAS